MKRLFDGFGWEIENCMLKKVLKQIQTIVIRASFLPLNANDVTTIDNQPWISMHAYVMHAWKKIPILLTFEHVC
jgi:hypothetical protein